MLKKGKGDQRIAKIFDRCCTLSSFCPQLIAYLISFALLTLFESPLMPEDEATFVISNGGIDDVN